MTILQEKHIKKITLKIEFDNTKEYWDSECKFFRELQEEVDKIKANLIKNNMHDLHKKQSIRLFNDGWSDKGIADFLEIEVYEVENYLKNRLKDD